ncbi:hypothetical protein STEG23_026240 [Scotinomys teguina]
MGWNLPSSAFCKAGFVDRLGLFMVSQISWTFCFMTFLDLVFSLTDDSISSITKDITKDECSMLKLQLKDRDELIAQLQAELMIFLIFLIALQALNEASLLPFLCKHSLPMKGKGMLPVLYLLHFLSSNQQLTTSSLRDEGFVLDYDSRMRFIT